MPVTHTHHNNSMCAQENSFDAVDAGVTVAEGVSPKINVLKLKEGVVLS